MEWIQQSARRRMVTFCGMATVHVDVCDTHTHEVKRERGILRTTQGILYTGVLESQTP